MLVGKGFEHIINLSGGFKAWNGERAFFGEEKGLELFSGNEELDKTLAVAYSMEDGLHNFYVSWSERMENDEAKKMFQKLSQIEIKHKERIFSQYLEVTGSDMNSEMFEENVVKKSVEGGLTSEEYINLFSTEPETAEEVVGIAMSIEAQALDLYMRAAERAESVISREALLQIAGEERMHLKELGKLIDTILNKR
jgi:rubrerythrin